MIDNQPPMPTTRTRKRQRAPQRKVPVAALAVGGVLVVILIVLAFVLPPLFERSRQSELHQRIQQVRGPKPSEPRKQTISLAGGKLTFELPTDFREKKVKPFQDSGGISVNYLHSFGEKGSRDQLVLSYGTTSLSAADPAALEKIIKTSSAHQLLARSEIQQPTVTSDRQGLWNGMRYRDVQISGTGGIFARARLFLVEGGFLTFEATWTADTIDRANAYFDSIRHHEVPLDAAAEPRVDRPRTRVSAEELNLLELVELQRDATQGEWIRFEDGIVSPPDITGAILTLPVEVPESYELKLSVQRSHGNESFNVGFPIGESMGMLVIDGFAGEKSGLGVVSGTVLHERSDAVSGRLLSSRVSELILKVTPQSVHAVCDGKTIVNWNGDSQELIIREEFWKFEPASLFLGSWESEFVIRSATLRRRE